MVRYVVREGAPTNSFLLQRQKVKPSSDSPLSPNPHLVKQTRVNGDAESVGGGRPRHPVMEDT